MNGFLCVNKPAGPSSFAVVKKLRAVLGEAHVGHTGTLDPAATGLLVVALGKATKLLSITPVNPKIYDFGIRFGTETDSLDSEGVVIAQDGRIPARHEIEEALPRFMGEQRQSTPRFSAVKIGGVRAYKLARSKVDFETKERTFTIHELSLNSFDELRGEAALRVVCSTGMYVRALARDIARSLVTFGYASFVCRQAVGPFALDQAVRFDDIGPHTRDSVIPLARVFQEHPSVRLTPSQHRAVLVGRDIPLSAGCTDASSLFAFSESGELVAVLQRSQDGPLFHPARVFDSAASGTGIPEAP